MTATERKDSMVAAVAQGQQTADSTECDDSSSTSSIVRANVKREICRNVVRQKLSKRRHLVCRQAIHPSYLDSIFPSTLDLFEPQTVHYNGGVAAVKEWKISCYLEVMDGGIPTANPNTALLQVYQPLLGECNDLFLYWYRQQHACSGKNQPATECRRLMTFLTRYTPNPGEQALLKHVDGAGKVDGSIVVALPVDRWSTGPEKEEQDHTFEGGGLTFWDGRETRVDAASGRKSSVPCEIHHDTRSGDVAFIDRAVWHQADPITKGTRWALVIFYKVS